MHMANFNCLTNFIGTSRSICTPDAAPGSNLYLEDLSGISLVDAAKLSTEEKLTGKLLMEDRINFAYGLVSEDYKTIIQRSVRYSNLLENGILGIYPIAKTTETLSDNRKGVVLTIQQSRNLGIYVNTVSLYAAAAFSDFIYVNDTRNGKELDRIPVTTIANEVVMVSINKLYLTEGQATELMISWNGNLANTIFTSLHGSYVEGCQQCPSESDYYPYVQPKAVTVLNASSKIRDNLRFTDSTGGLSVKFNLECSMDNYLCSIRNLLKYAYLYKAGSEFMLERIHSTRLNHYTYVTIDKAKELRKEYEDKYIATMNQLAENARPPDDVCFICKKGLRQNDNIP